VILLEKHIKERSRNVFFICVFFLNIQLILYATNGETVCSAGGAHGGIGAAEVEAA
jgi:hypothetical protein